MTVFSPTAEAHFFGHFGGNSEVGYACKPHHHGRFLHRCSDETHARTDVSHKHTGLQTYHARRPDFYLGVKTGSLNISSQHFTDNGMPLAIVVGYGTYDFSAEIEATRSNILPTEAQGFVSNFRDGGNYNTVALYGVHRFGGTLFGKVKVGIRKNWATIEGPEIVDEDLTIGIGAGKHLGLFSVEAEYTIIETKVEFFSVGTVFRF